MKIDDLTPPVAVPEPAWKQQLVEFWQQADDIRKIDLQVLLKMGDGDGARQLIESWQQEVVERRKKRARKKVKKKAKSAAVKYAWGGYWTPGYNFGDTELGGAGDGGGGGESVREAVNTGLAQGSTIGDTGAQSTWDGVGPDTQMTVNEDNSSAIQDFVAYCVKELGIKQTPRLRLRRDPTWSERNHSFGQFDPARRELNVSVAGRHIMDIFRTVAHELVHYQQNEQNALPADAGATGSEYENQANAQAGVLMRNYAELHPEYFEDVSSVSEAVDSNNKPPSAFQWSDWATVDPETGFALPMESVMSICEAQLAKNKILLESNSQRSVSYFTDLFNLGSTPQVGSTYLMTMLMLVDDKILVGNEPAVVKVIEQTAADEFVVEKSDGSIVKFPHEVVKDRVIYHTFFFNNQAEYNKLKLAIKMKFDTNLSESSGYIPTKRERNDPRFKMALTPDVRPGATGKNANKLGLKTGPQGEPTLLMKELGNALREFKATNRLPITEDQDLFEIDMSPSNLRKLVRNIDARAGIEFEMIVPGVRVEDEDMEPDYDSDERVDSIEEAYDFFFDGDYNGRGDVNRLKASMQEDYYIWRDEQLSDQWDREGLDYLRDYIDNNDLFDRDDHMEAAQEYVRELFADEDEPVDEQSDRFLDAVTERLDSIADEFVESEWEDQGRIYDDAREQFDEEMGDTYDESDWLRSENIRYMSDITNFYSSNVTWPYWRGTGGDGEMDIDTVAADFQDAIGRPVNAASSYHGGRREAGTYVVEPDGSLTGDDSNDGGLEFVSPPLPLDELLSDMEKVRKWAGQYGCYTNSSTGLHMNVSVPDTSTSKLDYVKLALLLGDEHVLKEFGRASNTYAGSALKKIREILKTKPDAAAEVLNKMRDHMEALATKVIHSGETQKFTSINTKGNYVEFRSPGGDWLDENWDKVTPTLLRTVVALDAAMDPNKYRKEYQKKLYKLLDSSQERLASPNVNKLLSMYFTDDSEGGSREIAVQLAKELLVKRDPSRKVQEPKPADGQPAAPGSGKWGLWITGLDKFATRNNERLEFDSRETARDWYADEAMMRPGIRSDVEIREIPAEPAAAASAQPDQGSGAYTYRVFNTDNNQTVGTFQSDGIRGSTNASIAFRNYLQSIGRDSAAGFNYEEIGRERPQVAAQQTAAAQPDLPEVPLDIEIAAPRTLTTPGQPQQQFTGNWLVKDADGNILATFSGIGNVQADANRVAIGWLRQNPQYMQDGVEVVPEMSE